MTNFYEVNAQVFIDNTLNLDMSAFYERFETYVKDAKPGMCLLDIGCGPGRDLKYFSQKYKAYGLEPAKALANYAADYTGVLIYNCTLDEFDSEIKYDLIWACASLLHIPRHNLPKSFAKIKTLLKPEGAFYCSFKYGTKEETRDIRHFTDMNEELMEEAIKKSGFKVGEFWLSEDVRPGREGEFWGNWVLVHHC